MPQQPPPPEAQTLRSLRQQAEDALRRGPHPERARLDAESLLLHLLRRDNPDRNRAWLITHDDLPATPSIAAELRALITRRAAGEPIQYILGKTEFYGLPFRVTPDVLIPRPETEHLVERVLQLAPAFAHPRIVDVGTGSGAIAIALAHALPQAHITTIDISAAALTVARQNATLNGVGVRDGLGNSVQDQAVVETRNGVGDQAGTEDRAEVGDRGKPEIRSGAEGRSKATDRAESEDRFEVNDQNKAETQSGAKSRAESGGTVRFLHGSLLGPVAAERFEFVVSNPPYVPESDRMSLSVEVRDHEPDLALYAGADGLDIYRHLIPAAYALLMPGGFIVLEIGYNQSDAIRALLSASGFEAIDFTSDLQGIPRVATARRAK